MKIVHFVSIISLLTLAVPALPATEMDQLHQATTIMNRFKSMPERQIPHRILREAKGLAILNVVKGGFIISAKGGEGVIVAHLRHGWSGPSFITTGGVGVGPQIGGEVTELVLVLNTPEAVRAFSSEGNVRLGGELSVAAGPMGRSAEAGVSPKAAVYAYSRSQGLFAGASLEGTVIATNKKANARFYHTPVSASAILSGRIAPPPAAAEFMASL